MLAFAFFASVFTSFMWLIYMILYLRDKVGSAGFNTLGLLDIALYVALLILPICVLWMIFGYVYQYLTFQKQNHNMHSLFQQMKKNQDYTDLVARVLLEMEQELKDGFILNKFELFIADMNELLAETIQRGALASPDQIDRLWAKVRNGGKWAFGKVIIEVNANQNSFGNRLVGKAATDSVLAGTVLEFCARYQNLLTILEKHDKERIFLAVIETGVYGKVYSILAPLAGQIRNSRSTLQEKSPLRAEMAVIEEDTPVASPRSPVIDRPAYSQEEEQRKSFIEVFNPFKRRQADSAQEELSSPEEKDPFSAALERSFGASDDEPPAPRLSPQLAVDDEMPAPVLPKAGNDDDDMGFTHTQRALHNLKKEWEEIKEIRTETAVSLFERKEPTISARKAPAAEKEAKDKDYAYPFGNWTDTENYDK